MAEMFVKDNICWVCGKERSDEIVLTQHHTIPQNLTPVNNVVVPVCEKCHDKINESDINSVYQWAIKINKNILDLNKQATRLTTVLENNTKIQITYKNKEGK